MQDQTEGLSGRSVLRRIGPAFIVGATIIGPGSITLMSKTGSLYGYSMLWLSVLAGVLMACFIALFMRFGILCEDTFLGLTAKKLGRWYAVICGVGVFCIAAAFQFGNCMGVTAAMGLLLGGVGKLVWPFAFTVAAIAFMFAFKRIYTIIEKMMTVLLILMLAAFAANLVLARPSGLGILHGACVPTIPPGVDWITIGGLVATTFSIAGAFFQSYLVKAKGWGERDLASGTTDTVLGSIMLTLIGTVIMMTAASVLHPRGIEVTSATDMVIQLERVFGAGAKYIFCIGFWAAAFSSFVTNALVGGVMVNDGVGLGGKLDSVPTKVFATLVLLVGMTTAVLIMKGADAPGGGTEVMIRAIVVGQAATLVAVPLCAIAMVVVLFDKRATGGRGLPLWAKGLVPIGAVVLLGIATRTLLTLWTTLRGMLGLE
ncbi:MAG: Nramp family divalent metal transporter [Armatimonadota bacterium]|jgi:Mn2+/Fe2+ NRAMP family transporter